MPVTAPASIPVEVIGTMKLDIAIVVVVCLRGFALLDCRVLAHVFHDDGKESAAETVILERQDHDATKSRNCA